MASDLRLTEKRAKWILTISFNYRPNSFFEHNKINQYIRNSAYISLDFGQLLSKYLNIVTWYYFEYILLGSPLHCIFILLICLFSSFSSEIKIHSIRVKNVLNWITYLLNKRVRSILLRWMPWFHVVFSFLSDGTNYNFPPAQIIS